MARAKFDDVFPNVNMGGSTIGEYIIPKRGKTLISKDAVSGDVPVIAGGLVPTVYHNVANTKEPVITISASGANAGFVNLWSIPVWSSDSSFIDKAMTDDVYFWYVMLKKRQSEIYESQTGSAQPHIYPSHIAELPTIALEKDEIATFTEFATPLFEKIAVNIAENLRLAEIRDTLLPRLMCCPSLSSPLNDDLSCCYFRFYHRLSRELSQLLLALIYCMESKLQRVSLPTQKLL
jgi:type I restriction enzyme S subunit